MNGSNVTLKITPGDVGWSVEYTENLRIQTYDRVLGSALILGTLIGLLGNSSAVLYFWPRRHKTIHDIQYLVITTVDFFTVSSCFPIITSLLNDRFPMLFSSNVFCTAWTLVNKFTRIMSMFLATLICVTRTVAMTCPHRTIKRCWVIRAIAGYAAFIIATDVIDFSTKWSYGAYAATNSCCGLNFSDRAPVVYQYFVIVYSCGIALFLTSLITFVCFVISNRFLLTRLTFGNDDDRKFRRVSVTITIFTTVFLVCNVPCLISQLLYFVHPTLLDGKIFQYYEGMVLFDVPVFLNAILNPVVYLMRMQEYQTWILYTLRSPGKWPTAAD